MDTQTKIFRDYLDDRQSDHHIVNSHNIEGYEDHFMNLLPADKNIRILDIGCGCGQLLYTLKKNGYHNLLGVDLGQKQVDLTRGLGIDAQKISDLEDFLRGKKGSYHVISLWGTIEHFPKDKLLSYLEAIRYAMCDGGICIIVTCNMSLLSGLFQRYIDFTHEFGFTEISLRQVLRISGFSGIEITGEHPKLKPRLKFLVWFVLRKIWFKVLGFIYLLEKGTDRPKILSRHLIAVAKK